MTRGPIFAILLSVAACTNFPDLEGTASPSALAADFPKLEPIDELLGGGQPPRLTEQDIDTLIARVGRLRARAAALRRPVIDRTTRARMQRALGR